MDTIWIWLLAIGVLCFVSMFFSIGAAAVRIFSRVKLNDAFCARGKEQLAEEFVKNAEKLGIGCAFYRLSANLAIAAVLLAWFTYANQWSITIWPAIAAFLTSLVLVSIFSIALPHSIAKYAGEKFLAYNFVLLRLSVVLAIPIIVLVRLYDAIIRRITGAAVPADDAAQDELLNVIEQGKIEGVVDEEEQRMIEGVLELSQTPVQKIMTPRTDIVSVSVESGLSPVFEAISTGHSRIPVYEGTIDNIIGFVHAKDMLAEAGRTAAEFNLREKLRAPYFVPQTKPLRILLREFQRQKLHIAVVLDEYGGTAGIVTIEDILEELVGEIADEYEEMPKPNIVHLDKSSIEIDARLHIDELNAEFAVELPEEEDYDTVGGFILSHLGCIPRTGQEFEWNGLKFFIVSAEIRKINRVRITKGPDMS